MLTALQKKRAAAIMYYYGRNNQLDILQEECAELIQAVSKIRQRKDVTAARPHCKRKGGEIMGLFWFGVLVGAVTMFMTMILLFAQAVDEKERQIEYLKKQLRLQAVQAKGVHDEY